MKWRFEHRFHLFTPSPMFSPYFPIRLATSLLKESWSQSRATDFLHQGLPLPGEKAAEPIMKKCSKISQVSRGSKSSKTSDKEKSDVKVRVVPDTLLVSISPDLVCTVIVKEHPWDHYLLFSRKKHQIQQKICSWTWNQGLNIEVAVYWRGRGRGAIAVQLNATWNLSIIDTFSSSLYILDVRVIINMSTLLLRCTLVWSEGQFLF